MDYYYTVDKITYYVKNKFGIPILKAGTSEEWDQCADMLQKEYPWYFKFEKLVYDIDLFISRCKRKLEDFSDWFRYRTYDKYHVVDTKLEPKYYDKNEIILHANFSLLVDYVENECAWMHEIAHNENRNRKRGWKPNEEQGLAYLRWASDVKNESFMYGEGDDRVGDYSYQAIVAQEVMKLYLWWKYDYAARCDVFEFSDFEKETPDDRMYLYELEDKYKKEEDEMLIRLMKIRRGLWT